MKVIVAACLMIISTFAYSQSRTIDKNKLDYCNNVALIMDNAISARNIGLSPERALKDSDYVKNVPVAEKKKIINSAFFDPQLTQAPSGNVSFINQVATACMRDWKTRYQPLK